MKRFFAILLLVGCDSGPSVAARQVQVDILQLQYDQLERDLAEQGAEWQRREAELADLKSEKAKVEADLRWKKSRPECVCTGL